MNTIRIFTLICIFSLSFIQLFSQNSLSEKVAKSWEMVQSDTTSEVKLKGYFWTIYYAKYLGKEALNKYLNQHSDIISDTNCSSDLCQHWIDRITAFTATLERDFEKAEIHYKSAIEAATQLKDSLLLAENCKLLGNLYNSQDKFSDGLEYLEIAKEIYYAQNKLGDFANILNDIGIIYDLMGAPEKAIETYDEVLSMKDEISENQFNNALYNKALVYDSYGQKREALEIYHQILAIDEKKDNKQNILLGYRSIASINRELKDFENAKKYNNKAIAILEALNDKEQLASIYLEVGAVYKEELNHDEAIKIHKKGLALAEEIASDYYIAGHSVAMANTLMSKEIIGKHPKKYAKKQYLEIALSNTLNSAVLDEVYELFKRAYDIGVANKNAIIIDPSSSGLGKNHFYRNDFRKALEYLYQALQSDNSNAINKMNQQFFIAFAESQVGNNKAGFEALNQSMILRDSIYNLEKVQDAAKIQADFEFEKEREILAAQKKADEAVLKAETAQTRTAATGIGLLAILGFAFFWNARRKNKTISQQNQQLEELNITKDRIFAIIGHDLRKPAIGFRNVTKKVNYLLQKQDYKTLSALGNSIEKDALALNKLTDNLLSWALTQKDVMPYNPTALPLREVTNEVIDIFRQLSEEKEITINNEISENLEVYADLNSLQAIIRNLVDNGVKYSNKDDVINITAVSTDKGVKIEIADTGIGMNQEKLRDIFLLKKEKSQKGTKREKGTGLGLHLVQELVKLNKGLISVKSQLDMGTNFEVVLPRVA